MPSPSEPRNIVIVGGGIIGCSTAYFLTRHPSYDPSRHKITLLEASRIAGGASGKAGGLLALWAYPKSLVPLSYSLHASLAKEHNGAERWGYRAIHCGSLSAHGAPAKTSEDTHAQSLMKLDAAAQGKFRAARLPQDLDWFDPGAVRGYDEMGTPSTTAQVHPFQFTTAMAELAQEKGVDIITGARVTGVNEADGEVKSVSYKDAASGEEKQIEASDIVVAAGPWTQRVLPMVPISGMRAHSVTIKPAKPVSAYAIFTEIKLPTQGTSRLQHVSPEIYARPNDEVYACGEGDKLVPLPDTTADVETDQSRIDDIIAHVGSVSGVLKQGEVTARQACYLPNLDGPGGPLVGLTGTKGLLVASGHTCWGIQNGPGTGKVISEFVFEGKAVSAKVGGLDPRNFM